MKIKKTEIRLSPRQEHLSNLYLQAKGKTVFWVKKNATRVLDPDEIIVVEGRIS